VRRIGDVFEPATSVSNLWAGWCDLRRGERRRQTVARFEIDAAAHVHTIHEELRSGRYRPGAYRTWLIHDPKTRRISAAPVGDRVVHHAIHRVLAPSLDRHLVDHRYACVTRRGSHRAVLRFQRALRQHRHVMLLDIRACFPTVDRDVLIEEVMARMVKDRAMLELLRRITGRGVGLPIGNLLSQWWGNHYLSALDHHLKRALRLPHAQRYMDDLALFSDDRGQLASAREAAAEWLLTHRRQALRDPTAPVQSTRARFRYLGYRVCRGRIRPGRRMVTRLRRRVAAKADDPRALEAALAGARGALYFPGELS